MWNIGNIFTKEKRSRLLVYDVHRGQTTGKVKSALQDGNTTICMVPPDTTSKIQPLDSELKAA